MGTEALYYPFHLCHEKTLARLLDTYERVHFRDYMALQLGPMHGTTAYADRMGDRFPDLVATGRLIQGYNVNGPLDPETSAAVDRDLTDPRWRAEFHRALSQDRRFQRGLFGSSHAMGIGRTLVPLPAALLELMHDARRNRVYGVALLRELAAGPLGLEEGYDYEYAWALVKTSAALRYTVGLAQRHGLVAVTDSASHYGLLARTCERDDLPLANRLIERVGY